MLNVGDLYLDCKTIRGHFGSDLVTNSRQFSFAPRVRNVSRGSKDDLVCCSDLGRARTRRSSPWSRPATPHPTPPPSPPVTCHLLLCQSPPPPLKYIHGHIFYFEVFIFYPSLSVVCSLSLVLFNFVSVIHCSAVSSRPRNVLITYTSFWFLTKLYVI